MIILHVGTNDLVSTDMFSMRQRIKLFLHEARLLYPKSLLIWSDILPRVFYFGANTQKAMEKKRRKINKWAEYQATKLGCQVLHHPQFQQSKLHLFRYDAVHLSVDGNMVFRENIQLCIRSFLLSWSWCYWVILLYTFLFHRTFKRVFFPVGRAVRVWHYLAGIRHH